MQSGRCQLSAPVESCIEKGVAARCGSGDGDFTSPVAGVECASAMCLVADSPEFARALWSNWPPGVSNPSSFPNALALPLKPGAVIVIPAADSVPSTSVKLFPDMSPPIE